MDSELRLGAELAASVGLQFEGCSTVGYASRIFEQAWKATRGPVERCALALAGREVSSRAPDDPAGVLHGVDSLDDAVLQPVVVVDEVDELDVVPQRHDLFARFLISTVLAANKQAGS